MRDARYVRLISWTLQSGSEQKQPKQTELCQNKPKQTETNRKTSKKCSLLGGAQNC
jgi:hypothetical protein